MADQTIPPKPRYGTVERFEELMRHLAGESSLYPYALGVIEGIVTGLHTDDADKVQHVKNVLIAVNLINKRPSDQTDAGLVEDSMVNDEPRLIVGETAEEQMGNAYAMYDRDEGLAEEVLPECGAWCADGPGGLCTKDRGHDGEHGPNETANEPS